MRNLVNGPAVARRCIGLGKRSSTPGCRITLGDRCKPSCAGRQSQRDDQRPPSFDAVITILDLAKVAAVYNRTVSSCL